MHDVLYVSITSEASMRTMAFSSLNMTCARVLARSLKVLSVIDSGPRSGLCLRLARAARAHHHEASYRFILISKSRARKPDGLTDGADCLGLSNDLAGVSLDFARNVKALLTFPRNQLLQPEQLCLLRLHERCHWDPS